MSFDEIDLIERLHAVADEFAMPPAPLSDDVLRGRRRVRRHRALLAGAATLAVVVVLGVTAAVTGQDRAAPDRPDPVEPPDAAVADAVWYDAHGLHHGGHVQQPPGEITRGTLALVRSG